MGILTSYNGYALSTYGLREQAYSGVLDLPDRELSKRYLPGSSRAHVTTLRRIAAPIVFAGKLSGDEATMLANLAALKAILMVDNAYHPLIVSNRPGLQIQALAIGIPLSCSWDSRSLWTFPLAFDRFPYWEDIDLTTDTVTASPDTLVVGGTDTTYPTYTCSILVALATGLWFEVSGHRFIYTGALEAGDSLVVDTDDSCPDVKLNGVRDWEHVSSASAYPSLNVGNNPVSFSDPGSVVIDVSWRERSQ